MATIGIRGTDYLAVQCDTTCAQDPVIRSSLAGNGDSAIGGTVVGVIAGSVAVQGQICPEEYSRQHPDACQEHGLETVLKPSEYLIALRDGQQVRLPSSPHFLTVDPFPNPAGLCQ